MRSKRPWLFGKGASPALSTHLCGESSRTFPCRNFTFGGRSRSCGTGVRSRPKTWAVLCIAGGEMVGDDTGSAADVEDAKV